MCLPKRVGNYHEVERKFYAGLRSHRENENREFFRISEEEVINFLELIPGEEVTPTEDVLETVEDKAAFEKTSRHEHRFNFDFVEIPKGAVLEFSGIQATPASSSQRTRLSTKVRSIRSVALG